MGLEDIVQGRDPDHQQGLGRHRLETIVQRQPCRMFQSAPAGHVPAACWALGTLWQDRQVQLLPSARGNVNRQRL